MTTALFKISDGANAWRARLERPNLADLQRIVLSKGIKRATLRYSWEGELLNLDSDDDLKEALLLAKDAGTNIIRILINGAGVTGGDSDALYDDDGSGSVKNSHEGAALNAYFDEEKKKWIFPGENQGEDSASAGPPSMDAAPAAAQTPGDGAASPASSELPSSNASDGEAASKVEGTKEEKEAAAAAFITSVLRSLDQGDQRLDGLLLTMMPGGSNHDGFKALVEAYPNIFRSIPGPCSAFLRQFGGFAPTEFFTAGGCRQSARRCGQRYRCQRQQGPAAEAPPSKHFGGQEVSDFEMALQKAIEASLGQ